MTSDTGDRVSNLQPLLSRVRTDVCWIKRSGAFPSRLDSPLTDTRLAKHCNGGPACGVAPMQPGSSLTLVALLDLDSHQGATSWDDMVRVADALVDRLVDQGLYPTVFRSSGGRGIHIYLIWDEPQDARSVRAALASVLASCGLAPGTKGVVADEVEVFPKQNRVPEGKFGNMFVLPLAGESVPLHYGDRTGLVLAPRDAPVSWYASEPVPALREPETSSEDPSPAPPVPESLESLRQVLLAIPNDTEPLDYDEWRNVIFAIHHATGGSDDGLALAHEFSARSPKHDPVFLDERVWPYIDDTREDPITLHWLKGLAGRYGWAEDVADQFEILPPLEDETVGGDVRDGFEFVDEDTLFARRQQVLWWVKGVLPRAGLVVVYGASGSGKTFAVLDLVAAISRGVDWRTRRVHQGRVAYICAEGAQGFIRRLMAYGQVFGRSGIRTLTAAPNFMDVKDPKKVIDAIRAAGGADIVVVDTLAQVALGGNENAAEDMGKVLKACRGIHASTGATVLLIHHSGKDESKGARGWSGLRAAADAELEVLREGEQRTLGVTKMKDGDDGGSFSFTLREVPLFDEVDADGEVVTSCVVEHNDAPAAGRGGAGERKAGGRAGRREMAILSALDDALTEWVSEEGLLAAMGIQDRFGKGNTRRALENMVQKGMLEKGSLGYRAVPDGEGEG